MKKNLTYFRYIYNLYLCFTNFSVFIKFNYYFTASYNLHLFKLINLIELSMLEKLLSNLSYYKIYSEEITYK